MNLIPKRRFEGNPTDFGNQAQRAITDFKRLNIGTAQIKDASITNAKIGLLAVENANIANATIEDAKINTCSISKLTVGNLTVTGTITTGKLVTGAAGTNRIELDANYVAGYNSSNVLQFYLSAADGKAYAGGGNIILGSSGLDVKYGANFRMFYGAVQVGSLAIASTSIALNSTENLNLSSGGITKKITLFPTGGHGVVVYDKLFYPDGTDKEVDLGSTTYRFRRAYCSPVIPIYNAETSEAEEGSMTYSWNGTILTLLVYASGSWRMHPAP